MAISTELYLRHYGTRLTTLLSCISGIAGLDTVINNHMMLASEEFHIGEVALEPNDAMAAIAYPRKEAESMR